MHAQSYGDSILDGYIHPMPEELTTAVELPFRHRVRHGVRKPHNWLQLIRFAAVGASGYIVNLAVFAVCVHLIGIDYKLAAVAAFVVSVLNNFWWNRHWTFRAQREAHPGRAGSQVLRDLADRVRLQLRGAGLARRRRGLSQGRGAGDLDRRRDAAVIRGAEAVELQGLRACSPVSGPRRAPSSVHRPPPPPADHRAGPARAGDLGVPAVAGAATTSGSGLTGLPGPASGTRASVTTVTKTVTQTVAASGSPVLVTSHDHSAQRLPADRREGAAARRGRPQGPGGAAQAPQGGALRVHQGLPHLAGELVLAHQAPARAAPGLRRRQHRRRHPVVDRLSGRVDDGPRLPGRLRAPRQRLYIWLPLCILFRPFLPWLQLPWRARRPSLWHLDLLVLLSFSVSLAFFNHAHIDSPSRSSIRRSLPAAAHAAAARATAAGAPRRPLRTLAPDLVAGRAAIVFLIGFRIGLNVTDSNVIDVGYAGVIGADQLDPRRPLYGHWPHDNEHGDTYGPVNYEAYVPFQQIFGWSGTWDDLPAAHARRDLLRPAHASRCCSCSAAGMRGPTLGVALAYALGLLSLHAVRAGEQLQRHARGARWCSRRCWRDYRSRAARARRARGAGRADQVRAARARAAARAARTARLRSRSRSAARALARSPLAFAAWRRCRSPRSRTTRCTTIYERTIVYQSNRDSPFSVWGLYGLATALQRVVEVAAVALALALGSPAARAAAAWSGWRPRGAGDPDRRAARHRTLVLPLHPLVLPARRCRPAGALPDGRAPAAWRTRRRRRAARIAASAPCSIDVAPRSGS